MTSSNNQNDGCTIFPVYYLGRVQIFFPVSKMTGEEKNDLMLQCCFKIANAAGINIRTPERWNSTTNINNYINDEIILNDRINEIFHFQLGERSICVIYPEVFTEIFNHSLNSVSCISSFQTREFGLVCYVYKNIQTSDRMAYAFVTNTIGLEQQIVNLAMDMFSRLSNHRIRFCASNDTINSSLKDVSFVSGNENFIGSARLEKIDEKSTESFHDLNFLRPSSNFVNSTVGSVSTLLSQGSEIDYRISKHLKHRATDGTCYVPNNMLHFERWYHGSNILYSKDCFRNPGDFFVYKWQTLYILRVCSSENKVEDIILQDESKDKHSIMFDNNCVYHGVSHYVNYHMFRQTKFLQKDGKYFTLKNPILRIVNDRWFCP